MAAEFRVLGPLEALVGGRHAALAAEKPRALLALLLLARGRVVSVDHLIAGLWGDEAPDTATKALQVYVSQVRKAIGPDRVATKPPGYSLRIEEGELDLDRFEGLVREGRALAAGDPLTASERLAEALALWRGPALAEFAAEPFAAEAGARLEDARLGALEARIDADLALGRDAQLVGELEELVARNPLRERLRGQLMLALYRSGRQADALDLYRRTRATLMEELGIEPGPALRELEQAILIQDPALKAGRRPEAEPGEARARPARRGTLIALGLIVAAAAAVVISLALSHGGSGTRDAALRGFVVKVENFLAQSSEGRRAVVSAIGAESNCRLTPRAAALRLDRVQRNRQSLLQQVAALSVPDDAGALKASDLLQKSVQASIAADWHYRDWLVARKRCGPPDRSPDLQAALVTDGQASRTKRAFVAAFDPLAQRFGQRAWSDWQF